VKRSLSLVVLALFVSLGLLAQESPEEAILAQMNHERVVRGLKPLHLNLQLALAANDRVKDMLSKHYFSHVSPTGVQPWYWIDQRGYEYREVGENLAVGYRGPEIVNGWMHSREHRENILMPQFDEVGIAISNVSPMHGYGAPLVVALYGEGVAER
jgi:uncharacterized protein YkwD